MARGLLFASAMSYVITSSCVGRCNAACASVCPVDAIHGEVSPDDLRDLEPDERERRGLRLFIDRDACIDCSLCTGECPEEAIFHEDDLPAAARGEVAAADAFFAGQR